MGQEKEDRIRRFTLPQRIFHLLLILSFLIQGFTGVARMYIETSWGQGLAYLFGGYAFCTTIHTYVGIFMISLLIVHVLYLLSKIDWAKFPGILLGPDSLLPHPRDAMHFLQHVGWFVGFSKAPRFDRWGYWEKFDYWAVFWGIPVLGITGLLLAYPLITSHIIPGWGLNVVLWIHRIEAILAMGHVFIIHFFIGHLRRHNFPMDHAMFEGSVDLESTRHEKPAWVARLEKEDQLQDLIVPRTSRRRRILFYCFGYAAMAAGVFLLIGGIINSPYITW